MKKILFITLFMWAVSIHANVISSWTQLTASAAFPPRGFGASCVYDGKIWMIGGANFDVALPGNVSYNDVWYSTNGVDWIAATRNANWIGRRRIVCYTYAGKMWIAAGVDNNGTYLRDVWNSSDGIDWTCVTKNAAWGDPAIMGGSNGRIPMHRNGIVFNGKMWLISGQQQDVGCVPDVWSSTNGADWTAVTRNAEFIGRSGGACFVALGKMCVAGGATCFGGLANNIYTSTDGALWTKLVDLDQGHLQHETGLEWLNRIWIFGGSTGNPGPDQDYAMWLDSGLLTWNYDTQGYGIRESFEAQLYNSQIYLYAGYNNGQAQQTPLNDVWLASINSPTNTPIPTRTPTVTKTYTRTVTPTNVPPTVTQTITPYNTFTGTPTKSPTFTATPTITLTATFQTSTPTVTLTPPGTPSPTFTVTPFPTPLLKLLSQDIESNGLTAWLQFQRYDNYAQYAIAYGPSLENIVWLTNDYNATGTQDLFNYPLCCLRENEATKIHVTVYTDTPPSIMVSNDITVTLSVSIQGGMWK